MRRCLKILYIICPALLWCVLMSGCQQKPKQHTYTIGFSQCVSTLWRKAMLDEMKMELSFHPEAKLIYADAGDKSAKQITQVKAMLDQGIDLLIISPDEAAPLTPIIEETYTKGIPVIIIDRKSASNLYTAYVGADNHQIGKMAAQYLGSSFKKPAKILEITGLSGSSSAIERSNGFDEGLQKFKDVLIAIKSHGDWLKEKSEAQVLANADKLNDIDAIFAQNDMMASGARDALNRLKIDHEIKIIGVDALPGEGAGLEMVEHKIINGSMLYPTGGKEAIITAFKILNKEPFVKDNILPTTVIDSANVQLMKMQWNKINSQQKDIERQQTLIEGQQKIYNNQRFVLNVIAIALMLTIISVGIALYSLKENKKINKSLEQKNMEIIEQKNQLIEISAKANEATEAKLNFFTNISHEFRTPLTLILSPLEDMLANNKINTLAGKNLSLIHKNVFRLLRLVNELIDYRKIEYNKMKLNASPINMVGFIQDIYNTFQQNAKKRNIDFRLTSDEEELIVWFDANMMDKILFNLLSNAFNFTSNNGKIEIAISKKGNEEAIIEVRDNGIGMSDECALHVFDLFYQADSQSTKGSGLGLALSKDLIQLHHGNIQVDMQKPKGTTFQISLPLGDAHLKQEEKIITPIQGEKNYDLIKLFTTHMEDDQTLIKMDPSSPDKEQSILIIEDNRDLLEYLSLKFADHYEVFVASDGALGLNEAYNRVPDLIISDIVLPELSGKELTVKLKSDIRTSHIPVILLTARGSIEQQIEGIKNLADLYLTKPFNFEFLLENVRNLMKNRLLLKEHFTSEFSSDLKIPISKSLDKKFINEFSGIVENNLSNPDFSIEDLSKTIGISRMHLYRKVKALLGYSIADYIMIRRLKKAKYLLLHENYSIAEITQMVGFSSPAYFTTTFKNKYQLTPTEFKKGQKKLIEI